MEEIKFKIINNVCRDSQENLELTFNEILELDTPFCYWNKRDESGMPIRSEGSTSIKIKELNEPYGIYVSDGKFTPKELFLKWNNLYIKMIILNNQLEFFKMYCSWMEQRYNLTEEQVIEYFKTYKLPNSSLTVNEQSDYD